MERLFYILWNPEGRTPPTMRFDSYEKAAEFAEAMQRRIGVGTMYIMKSEQSITVTQKIKWEGLKYVR